MNPLDWEVSDDSLIGRLLSGYVAIEQTKVDQRLAASDPNAYHTPTYPQDAQATGASYGPAPAGLSGGALVALAAAGLLVYVLAR